MGVLSTVSGLGHAGSSAVSGGARTAAGSAGSGALDSIGQGGGGSSYSTGDISAMSGDLGESLTGQKQMTQLLNEFEKADKMIQQTGKAAKSATDDAAIL